jgi:hypothetical protein
MKFGDVNASDDFVLHEIEFKQLEKKYKFISKSSNRNEILLLVLKLGCGSYQSHHKYLGFLYMGFHVWDSQIIIALYTKANDRSFYENHRSLEFFYSTVSFFRFLRLRLRHLYVNND